MICLLLACAGCSGAFFSALNTGLGGPDPSTVVFDAGHGLALDVFAPQAADTPAPVVVFFHGGTWQGGERGEYRFVGDALAARGALALVPDYRKYPQVRFPDFMDDAAAAVAWAHDHARAHGGDPGRIFLAGHSAGAHIAALLATDPRYLEAHGVPRHAIAGLIGLAGAYDFLPSDDEELVAIFGSDPDQQARSQPVNFVDRDTPPALLIHGDADRLVKPANSRSLASELRANGVPVAHTEVAGIGHIRLLAGMRTERLADVLDPTAAFIHEQPARTPTPR
ncbi:alpha/beta hydrolase [Alkalisalibacterium limincola]|uniref:alpha/beta hydrolase n=1 Tax=Alkalisalibacterium limincola TaxID=2699169 RepID=UPI00164FD4BF|nr:alpha/beta hydrolase [Alkalisalibacterium limincola]